MIRQFTEQLGSGDFVSEQEEIAQDIKSRLLLLQGEYYRNLNEGMPWFEVIDKPTNLARIQGEVKSVALETNNVTAILDYESAVADRHLTVTLSVATIYGTVQIEETL